MAASIPPPNGLITWLVRLITVITPTGWVVVGIIIVGAGVAIYIYRKKNNQTEPQTDNSTQEHPMLAIPPVSKKQKTQDPQICAPNHRFLLFLRDEFDPVRNPLRDVPSEYWWFFCLMRPCHGVSATTSKICLNASYSEWLEWYKNIMNESGVRIYREWEKTHEVPNKFRDRNKLDLMGSICICEHWSIIKTLYKHRGIEIPEQVRNFYDNVTDEELQKLWNNVP